MPTRHFDICVSTEKDCVMLINGKQPNFLIITTDEERYPPSYENAEAKAYRIEHSKALQKMRQHGLDFTNHYTASTACAPSRASIYTGQYPSLHGVSQTPGIGKSSFDENMFWLKPNTVPTMGNYFRAAGYQTWYRGKWHISYEDIDVPGTQVGLLSNDINGTPFPERINLYKNANQLNKYGFDGWIGPEPHGALQQNDATARDPGFADQVCRTLAELDAKSKAGDETPFLLVSSFLNPHDIVLSGKATADWFPKFEQAKAEGRLPKVDRAPTADEALESKPRCQKDYAFTYPRMYLPQLDNETYRQFYYFLMAEVNTHIDQVYQALQNTSFFENTIIVYLSDHGEMLGAHGGLHQKWYNAYQETIHVPFVISNPQLFNSARKTDLTTSHVDLLPTLLGLADIDAELIRQELSNSYSEAQPLVGNDLSTFISEEKLPEQETVYFMTDDNVEVGEQMTNPVTGVAYNSIIQPKHIETIITRLPKLTGQTLWKYSRYFDNSRFYSTPGIGATLSTNAGNLSAVGNPDEITTARYIPAEYECYNLTDDPLEEYNLLSPLVSEKFDQKIKTELESRLKQQRQLKRRLPKTLNDQQDIVNEAVS